MASRRKGGTPSPQSSTATWTPSAKTSENARRPPASQPSPCPPSGLRRRRPCETGQGRSLRPRTSDRPPHGRFIAPTFQPSAPCSTCPKKVCYSPKLLYTAIESVDAMALPFPSRIE